MLAGLILTLLIAIPALATENGSSFVVDDAAEDAESDEEEYALSDESSLWTEDLDVSEEIDPDEKDADLYPDTEEEEEIPEEEELSGQPVVLDVEEPTVDTSSYNGFHQDPYSDDWYYYKDGEISTGTTDVIRGTVNGTTGWWNVVRGKVTPGITVAKNSNGWWYINENGMVDFNYTGFAKNGNGSWYCEDGKVTFKKQGILKDTYGGIGSKSDWYYVIDSKVQTDFTGLSNFSNANGWWYISKGKVDFSHNGVDKNKNGWWYVTDGKVQFGFTGLANYRNSNGWWYISKGKVNFNAAGVYKNKNGWWYVTGGKVRFSYNGFATNSNGKWYIENGKVTFEKNSVIKDTAGTIGTKGTWWYVVGSKVQTGFTGLANYKNANGWWYIKSGKVDFDAAGVYKNVNGWWYVKGGKVNFSYNGLAANSNGVWYIKGGKVDFSYNSTCAIGDTVYTIEGGKVVITSHQSDQTLTSIDLDILTSKKGLCLSRTLTQSEFNQIISKFMSSSYVKNSSYNTNNEGFIWNGGTRWDCSATSLYLMNYYLLTYDEAYQSAKKTSSSAGTSSWESTALKSVGSKASGAYLESGRSSPSNSVSQAMTWGNPVYTYKNVSQISASNPGNLRYGDLLFYGTKSGSTIRIDHVAIYLGQYYSSNGDKGYYQLENDYVSYSNTKEGRSSGVRISSFRTSDLVHVARIF